MERIKSNCGQQKNDYVVPPALTSDTLNEYFVNIGSSITEFLADPGELIWKNPKCIYSFSFQSINVSCVLDQMESLSNDSHLHVLDMDTRLIKRGAAQLTPSITKLLNMSLSSGVLPSDWKLPRVTPIFKGKGAKNDKSNFRPISIIGCINMIAKHEVQLPLMSYWIKHEMITIDQFYVP